MRTIYEELEGTFSRVTSSPGQALAVHVPEAARGFEGQLVHAGEDTARGVDGFEAVVTEASEHVGVDHAGVDDGDRDAARREIASDGNTCHVQCCFAHA